MTFHAAPHKQAARDGLSWFYFKIQAHAASMNFLNSLLTYSYGMYYYLVLKTIK